MQSRDICIALLLLAELLCLREMFPFHSVIRRLIFHFLVVPFGPTASNFILNLTHFNVAFLKKELESEYVEHFSYLARRTKRFLYTTQGKSD